MTPEQEYFRLRWRIARFVIDLLWAILVFWCGMRYAEKRVACEARGGTFDPPHMTVGASCDK